MQDSSFFVRNSHQCSTIPRTIEGRDVRHRRCRGVPTSTHNPRGFRVQSGILLEHGHKYLHEASAPWISVDPEIGRDATEKLIKGKPLVQMGSLMRTFFPPMVDLNWPELSSEERGRRTKDAGVRLRFCFEFHRAQHEAGRHLLHEHPQSATSWKEPGAMRPAGFRGVMKTHVHMCKRGVQEEDDEGFGFVLKPMNFLTNSPHVAEE